jgi:hypothetical protein
MQKTFTFKQQTLRCAVFGTNEHNKIPHKISRDFIVSKFKHATEHGLAMDFMPFENAINGDYEPSDGQLDSALSSLGWLYTGWKST